MNDQKALGAFIENVHANRKERTHKCCRSTAIVCYFIFYLPLERNMYLHLNKSESHFKYSTDFFLVQQNGSNLVPKLRGSQKSDKLQMSRWD